MFGGDRHATGPRPDFPGRTAGRLGFERAFWAYGIQVVGVDEAGRGPLAGPVVAAAVVLGEDTPVEGATDSKALTPRAREECYERIVATADSVRTGAASAREIDRSNIVLATAWAMARAIDRLPPAERSHVVIDGLPMKGLGRPHHAVVKGDALVHSVSCASIIAKVTRDRLMSRLARRHPGYGWRRNAGYGTAEHRAAIERLGPTPHHRMTFLGVQHELDL